jgi:hypothetical protein
LKSDKIAAQDALSSTRAALESSDGVVWGVGRMTEAIWRCGRWLVLLAFSASALCWVHGRLNASIVSIRAQSVCLCIVNCDDGLLFGVTHQTARFSITTLVHDNYDKSGNEQYFRSSPLNVTTPASLTSGFLVFAVRHWWLTLFCAVPVL